MNISRKAEINSKDEIELPTSQFNQMKKSLKQLIEEKEGVMEKLKNTNKELSLINIELVQKNEQLNKTQEQLLRADKLATVGTLTSGVCHELRNPLSAIKNAVFLLKGNYPGKQCRTLTKRPYNFLT